MLWTALGLVSSSQHCVGADLCDREWQSPVTGTAFMHLDELHLLRMGRGRDVKLCIEGMGHFSLGADLFAANSMETFCHGDRMGV